MIQTKLFAFDIASQKLDLAVNYAFMESNNKQIKMYERFQLALVFINEAV